MQYIRMAQNTDIVTEININLNRINKKEEKNTRTMCCWQHYHQCNTAKEPMITRRKKTSEISKLKHLFRLQSIELENRLLACLLGYFPLLSLLFNFIDK